VVKNDRPSFLAAFKSAFLDSHGFCSQTGSVCSYDLAQKNSDDMYGSSGMTSELGKNFHSQALVWTKARISEASAHWKRQVKRYFNDPNVLCNAANFFGLHGEPVSTKLYKRAKKLDSLSAWPARKLAYRYRYLASQAPQNEQPKLIRLALREVEDALDRRDTRGEKIGLLREFAPTVIKFGYITQAKKYARRLQYYGTGFYLWSQYAYLYLAWIDLREQRFRALEVKLNRLRRLFRTNPSQVATCNAALSFVKEALLLEDGSIARDILRILVFGSRRPVDETKEAESAEVKDWLAALEKKRKPKLRVLRRKMDRLF
jgi:hypothetical protein